MSGDLVRRSDEARLDRIYRERTGRAAPSGSSSDAARETVVSTLSGVLDLGFDAAEKISSHHMDQYHQFRNAQADAQFEDAKADRDRAYQEKLQGIQERYEMQLEINRYKYGGNFGSFLVGGSVFVFAFALLLGVSALLK